MLENQEKTEALFLDQNDALSEKLSVLYLASEVSEWELSQIKENARVNIVQHLEKFGGSTPTLTYGYKNDFVADVCKKTVLLLNKKYYPRVKEVYEYWARRAGKEGYNDPNVPLISQMIQPNWLTNIPRLLPDDPSVLKLLPFLLACYTINMPSNKLDPGDAAVANATNGWREIFYDQCDEYQKEELKLGGRNRKKNIQSLSNNFIIPSNSEEGILFYDRNLIFYRDEQKASSQISSSKAREYNIKFWENYHRFIIFCTACKQTEVAQQRSTVNYTLSMACFLSIWIFYVGKRSMENIEDDYKRAQIFNLIESEENLADDSIGAETLSLKIANLFPNMFKDDLFDSIF